MKNKSQNPEEVRRNSYKSECSITPIRVPFNGGSQQCGLSKKSQQSTCTQDKMQDCLVQEFRGLSRAILKKLEQNQNMEDIFYTISKHLQTFERILQKKLDVQIQETLALKIIHQEDAFNIQKLNKQITDLQDKLNKLSYSLTQTPLNVSPQKKSNNCSIELITKKPFRNTSYSFQEQTQAFKNVFTQEEKENYKQESERKNKNDSFMMQMQLQLQMQNQSAQKKRILKPKQFRL